MFRGLRIAAALCVSGLLLSAAPAVAQPFDNGSSGTNGTFPPGPVPAGTQYIVWNLGSGGLVRYCSAYDVTSRPETCTTELGTGQIPNVPEGGITNGVYQFDHVNVDGVTSPGSYVYIYVTPDAHNAPLTILSKNEIHLRYTQLYADGLVGTSTASGLQPSVSLPGGRPGPGGFAGGASGFAGSVGTAGNPGFGPQGGAAGVPNPVYYYDVAGHNAGAPQLSTTLTQLAGGSGGGGAASLTTCGIGHNNGAAGGGGGGALLVSANTTINFEYAYLYVTGGNGGTSNGNCYYNAGGAGAGGALKLVAPTLTGIGGAYLNGGYNYIVGAAPGGVIRVEGNATTLSLYIYGQTSGTVAATAGPITPAATPALRIAAVGGIAVPPAPTGNTATPDVNFPTPPAGAVSVVLSAANIPLGSTIKVRVTPQVGTFTEVDSDPLNGSVESSTATASVTIPPGYGSITATVTFGCTETLCALLPSRDRAGALVEVVASAGTSRAFIVTSDGRRIALNGN